MSNSSDNEKKIKHLEFLQLVITRMNVNSFLLKGWTITLVAALFVFAEKDTNLKYIAIPLVSIFLFWFLDGYYLSIERQYRQLYNEVRKKSEDEIDFDLDASIYNKGKNSFFPSTFSKTLIGFYGTLVLTTSIIICIIIKSH